MEKKGAKYLIDKINNCVSSAHNTVMKAMNVRYIGHTMHFLASCAWSDEWLCCNLVRLCNYILFGNISVIYYFFLS